MTVKILFAAILFLVSNSSCYGMNFTPIDGSIGFVDIGDPQISYASPATRLIKHASKGAITACRKSYVLTKNYAAKGFGAYTDVVCTTCKTKYSGPKFNCELFSDAHTAKLLVEIQEIANRGPRLHSEIAFLQDLTGVCDPARQNPAEDSILMKLLQYISQHLVEGDENFNLKIYIKNSWNLPCTSEEFKDDVGMDCVSYLHLFCEKINSLDLFQQITTGRCIIHVSTPTIADKIYE
jgi:hypothetical protein